MVRNQTTYVDVFLAVVFSGAAFVLVALPPFYERRVNINPLEDFFESWFLFYSLLFSLYILLIQIWRQNENGSLKPWGLIPLCGLLLLLYNNSSFALWVHNSLMEAPIILRYPVLALFPLILAACSIWAASSLFGWRRSFAETFGKTIVWSVWLIGMSVCGVLLIAIITSLLNEMGWRRISMMQQTVSFAFCYVLTLSLSLFFGSKSFFQASSE